MTDETLHKSLEMAFRTLSIKSLSMIFEAYCQAQGYTELDYEPLNGRVQYKIDDTHEGRVHCIIVDSEMPKTGRKVYGMNIVLRKDERSYMILADRMNSPCFEIQGDGTILYDYPDKIRQTISKHRDFFDMIGVSE